MGDDWVQRISRTRNIPYYFNTRTGVTQWETPPRLAEKDRNVERTDSGEEKDNGSTKKKRKMLSGTGTESKSSAIKDSVSAPIAMPSGCDTRSLPGNQQSLPRVILPRKKRKRKKPSSETTAQEDVKETKQPEPPDKCNLLAGPPAKRTQAVAVRKTVRKETVGPKLSDVNTHTKGNLMLNETSGASQPVKQTSPGSFSVMEVGLPLRTEGKVLVVVDTNVLINSVDYLQHIKGKTIKDLGEIMLTIPWIVMQELDQLKGPNCIAITPLSAAVRKALGFLHKNRTDPNIKGQSYNHFLKTTREKDMKGSNDDKILHYCLQCKKKYPGNVVVLLSNDKNLCLKASFSDVPSSGDKDFRNDISKQVKNHARLSISSDDNEVFSSPTKDQPSSGRTSPEGAIACISPVEFKCSGPFQSSKSAEKDLKTQAEDGVKRTVSLPTRGNDVKRSTSSAIENQSISNIHNTSSLELKSKTNVKTSCKSNIQVGENETTKQERLSTCNIPCGTAEANSELKKAKSSEEPRSDSVAERKNKERDYTKELMGFLKLLLVIILRHEMIESYTNHWLEIVHKKPPWSLLDALQCIKKHYIAVFGLLLGRHNAEEVDRLITIVKNVQDDDSFTSKQLETFQFATKEIIIPLKKTAKYRDIATKCEDDTERVYQKWKQTTQAASKTTTNAGIQRATKTPRISTSPKPLEEKESVQESEDMCISPPATTFSNGLESALVINNQEAREEIEERREGDGMDHVTFSVLSVFEAIYNVLKYHRDVIMWSFKHLDSGCPIEGLPTKDESLTYLSTALPLIDIIVQSLQRLIGSCIPVPAVLCEGVVHSLHAYVQALKLDLDISGFHPEMFQQFILSEDNRERIVRGSQQYSEVLQQLHECRVTLSHF